MKKLVFLILSVFLSNAALACMCMNIPAAKLAQEQKVILKGKVVLSNDNKTVVSVNEILKSETDDQKKSISTENLFVFHGHKGIGTCPSYNVELPLGTEVLFFPNTVLTQDLYTIIFRSVVVTTCSGANNYLSVDSEKAQEVLSLLK